MKLRHLVAANIDLFLRWLGYIRLYYLEKQDSGFIFMISFLPITNDANKI